MRILFLSAVLPYPLRSGGQVRIYNLLKELSKHHDITLAAFTRSQEERDHIPELSFCCKVVTAYRGRAWQSRYVLRSLAGFHSFLTTTYENSQMMQLVSSLSGTYDLIHIEPFYVYLSLPHTASPIVVAEHNIEYAVYRDFVEKQAPQLVRPFLRYDVGKLKREETGVWKQASAIITVSEEDGDIVKSYTSAPVARVANGVDLEYHRFILKPTIRGEVTFLFVGNFRWLPNAQALSSLVTDVWPALKAAFPKSRLRIIGQEIAKKLGPHRDPSISAAESIPDIREEYRKADILIAPTFVGGGTKYKILECMAGGVPVITTKEGSRGLAATPGEHVLHAVTAKDFVREAENLIQDNGKRLAIIKNARALIESKYSWVRLAKLQDLVWKGVRDKAH